MVRANHRDFEIDAVERAETRHHRREQDGDVDALAIHVLDANVRIESAARCRGCSPCGLRPVRISGLSGSRDAERASGVELMEIAEEIFRGARRGDLLQLVELGLELAVEILVIELVGLHHMPVGVDNLDSVEHALDLSRIARAKLKRARSSFFADCDGSINHCTPWILPIRVPRARPRDDFRRGRAHPARELPRMGARRLRFFHPDLRDAGGRRASSIAPSRISRSRSRRRSRCVRSAR